LGDAIAQDANLAQRLDLPPKRFSLLVEKNPKIAIGYLSQIPPPRISE
jgi:hypothetical protein